jgi:hypothetical protein
MPRFGQVPVEVPVQHDLGLLAPFFRERVERVLADLTGGLPEWPFETLRTPERQAYLYGFGREYDDGRGKVTNAATCWKSWHGYGAAIDIVQKGGDPWGAPQSFWLALGKAAEHNGLVWGGRWNHPDLPHLQPANCPLTPTDADVALAQAKGIEAVWEKYRWASSPLPPVLILAAA